MVLCIDVLQKHSKTGRALCVGHVNPLRVKQALRDDANCSHREGR
jgi:hypothetical protein